MTIDLSSDVERARSELQPMVYRLQGLAQLWLIFLIAHRMAKSFRDSRQSGRCGPEAHLAFTKAIVIDYGKPWTNNRSAAMRALDLSFLDDLVAKDVHEDLMELRHKMVAHIDEGFETQEVVVIGRSFSNNIPTPRRLTEVFVAMGTRIEMLGAPWWLDNSDTIEQILEHIGCCRDETGAQIRALSQTLVETSRSYGHVLQKMTDILSIQETDGGVSSGRFPDQHEGSIVAEQPVELRIGRQNVASMVTRYDSTPPQLEKTQQNGFRITVEGQEESGNYTFQVSFLDWQAG